TTAGSWTAWRPTSWPSRGTARRSGARATTRSTRRSASSASAPRPTSRTGSGTRSCTSRNDEGGRRKDESDRKHVLVHPSTLLLPPSSFVHEVTMPNGVEYQLLDVTKVYEQGRRAVHAVRGVSLAVAAGEFVSIMGPSGSGKSTLMHLLGALDTPTTGKALYHGPDPATGSDRERALLRRTKKGLGFP